MQLLVILYFACAPFCWFKLGDILETGRYQGEDSKELPFRSKYTSQMPESLERMYDSLGLDSAFLRCYQVKLMLLLSQLHFDLPQSNCFSSLGTVEGFLGSLLP